MEKNLRILINTNEITTFINHSVIVEQKITSQNVKLRNFHLKYNAI